MSDGKLKTEEVLNAYLSLVSRFAVSCFTFNKNTSYA